MPRIVRCGLTQVKNDVEPPSGGSDKAMIDKIAKSMLDKHLKMVDEAAKQGVQILCFQELLTVLIFVPSSIPAGTICEEIPNGPTIKAMQEAARKNKIVLVVPMYEQEQTGVYYNTAAVIDADGTYLGKYRKSHIPQVNPGFWEKFYFRPGNLGYPVFDTRYGKVGVYICYDRHFPEGARALGLNGAEVVFNPSATVSGLSEYLWKLEQPAHAAANGYFIGAINRVGTEAPWGIGEFYGSSYFCNPRGEIVAIASRDKEELLTADLDLDQIQEVRNTWQFYRDRRPETYAELVKL